MSEANQAKQGMALLKDWQQQKLIRALDVALADFCLQLEPDEPDMAVLAALVSRQLQEGHVCVELKGVERQLRGLTPANNKDCSPVAWWAAHSPADWQQQIERARLVTGEPQRRKAPLVLQDGRLYLYRMWQHEHRVADALERYLQKGDMPLPDNFADKLQQLFPPLANGATNWQKVACALAASGQFTLITGGPGTGKTTTVVRLLALLQQQALEQDNQALHVRLAAPTGKAAARLTESIGRQIAGLPVAQEVRDSIPAEVATLHRLLGSLPDTRRFRHHAGNPLLLDVLVVDEASMIDVEMMDNLLQAMPTGARLILLGDKDQLASVEAGAVLGELCLHAARGRYAGQTLARLEQLCAERIDMDGLQTGDAQQDRLEQRTAMLRHSHRFDGASGIGRLATAVNAMDVAAVGALLREGSHDLEYAANATTADIQQLASKGYEPFLQVLAECPRLPAEEPLCQQWASRLLNAFDRFRLLCALRQGNHGVEGLNRQIETGLKIRHATVEAGNPWYPGRPVMVTHNDYGLGLMNGDIGIAVWVRDETGGSLLRVAFPRNDGSGGVRFVLPSRLTAVETVFAMTVHKSQGSEFEHCALLLPKVFSPVLTKELLYTAITRARERFSLLEAGQGTLSWAIRTEVNRNSGLRSMLGYQGRE